MGKGNAIFAQQFKNAHYVGANYNTHIITLIHTIYGKRKCNTCITILKCTLYVGGKMQYPHYNPNPHYIW
jgi:hypothetical protein